MLLVHPVQEAVRFLPALLAVFVTGRSSDRSPWWDVAALIAVVALGVSRWFTTRYRITGGQIELRHGLLNRKLLATPADRLRTVDVTAPIWHRLLGLARVEIGTASGTLSERIVLDALAAPVAHALRAELLHDKEIRAGDAGPGDPEMASVGPVSETVLLQLDPRWVRYAPLTTSGLLTALAVWGFGTQFIGAVTGPIEAAFDQFRAWGVWVTAIVLVVAGTVWVALLAVTAYVLAYWDFRLTRHPGGTLHTSRGLLTTRSTSIEEGRIRGVELARPLLLRWARAAHLSAITTGLRRAEPGGGAGVAPLVPPAPEQVSIEVGVAVLGDPEPLRVALVGHGPAARRRRFVRAILPAIALAGLAGVLEWRFDLPVALTAAGFLPLLTAPLLAADRYAGLGHTLLSRYLITQEGSVYRRRVALQRDGIIGVVVRESYFQRRAGVATVVAATAAGRQGYAVLDAPAHHADRLVVDLIPQASEFRDR
jgi:putative membrane protein